MTYAVLITMWWFMATASPYSTYHGDHCNVPPAPMAMGPYPTEEMCVAAEKQVMPTNRDFWTQAERDDYDAKMKAFDTSYAKYRDWLHRLAVANPKPGKYQIDGAVFYKVEARSGQYFGGTSCGETCIDWNRDGIGVERSHWMSNGYNFLVGPHIPVVSPMPRTEYDTYTVNQPCAAIKGWYDKADK